MNHRLSENELHDAIAAYRFALIDLTLFLDTHPDAGDALAMFADYRKKLGDLEALYTQNYAPITACDVTGQNGWTWGETPMPEEGAN